ncbi:MAG: sulfatase-like hydrolase/transferase [Candidatus Lokiarchaeota archaeon]|nr:sulfatase-like hydrolase/transferase [Candidatus Lokiarchaeota archaeon]
MSEIPEKKPNVIFVFADQLRKQALGYTGDPNAITPHIDSLAQESVCFTNAISGLPVCSPYRASMLTGQYPLTHRIIVNDVPLNPDMTSIAKVYKKAGYDTAYIGKWHLDGSGNRSGFIPKERRQGFDFWKVLECTHKYMDSYYWDNDDVKKKWNGYDAIAQTKAAIDYIKGHDNSKPFLLFLSWGPPHSPYHIVPKRFQKKFKPRKIKLRPNVPRKAHRKAKRSLSGYYAHINALDECIGNILNAVRSRDIEKNTILIFTSDHGDLHYSQNYRAKQKPWNESVRVPFIIYFPKLFGNSMQNVDVFFDAPDIMPTLLGLCGIKKPKSIQGIDFSKHLTGETKIERDSALITCIAPFSEWYRARGGREFRGIVNQRYTYAKDINGPWLLYDNQEDPYQLNNLVNKEEYSKIQSELEHELLEKLRERKDDFLKAEEYLEKWGYQFDPRTAAIPYKD